VLVQVIGAAVVVMMDSPGQRRRRPSRLEARLTASLGGVCRPDAQPTDVTVNPPREPQRGANFLYKDNCMGATGDPKERTGPLAVPFIRPAHALPKRNGPL